jgi:hypothetical protein
VMTPAQLILLAKIGAVGVLIVGLYGIGHHQGEKAVQGRWDASKAALIASQVKLLEDHALEVAKLKDEQDATNRKISEDHEAALQKQGKKYEDRIAAINAAGGLRISRSICASPVTTTTETASDSGHNEDLTGTVKLPDEIANNLFSEARRADEIVEQARACQSWILQQGFYGVQIPHQ